MAANWYDPAVNAVAVLMNGGSIKIYAGSQPSEDASISASLLATLTFGSTAFAASASGTAAANAIVSGTASATGTAGFFAVCKSDGTVVGTGTCGVSGADLNLATTSIVSGAVVSCSSFTLVG